MDLLEQQQRVRACIAEAELPAGLGGLDCEKTRIDITDPARLDADTTLVLCGDSDQLTPPEHSQEIADLIAQAELHWIARCGHMLTMEHPAVVSQHIKRWLLQHGFI